jgi:hypothetical protein
MMADLSAAQLLPENLTCRDQALVCVTNAEILGVAVWTEAYLRATKRCCRYFQIIMNDRNYPHRFYFEVVKLVICLHCDTMYIFGKQYEALMLESSGILLVTPTKAK